MAAFKEGKVESVDEVRPGLIKLTVDIGGDSVRAVAFPTMTGDIRAGDRVVVNTTGIDLSLGTGGVGFVLWNLDGPGAIEPGDGHIIKLRYTPWQTEVASAEAPESPHHATLASFESLGGMPVVVCSLHSQIAGAIAGVKAARPDARVGYLMTDGAALPIAWSDLVASLKASSLLDITCTAGHAFGGDLEVVNVYSGLAALQTVGEVDVAVVAMGPGVVGTGTALGFTGMEQGQVLDAVTALDGTSVACLRINFSDRRARHKGLSHHSVTALSVAAREPAIVAVPELSEAQRAEVIERLHAAGISERHEIVTADGAPGLSLLRAAGVTPSSMGRTFDEIPELFAAGAAAGAVAIERHPER
jgi:Protein of unknown function (DUF3866)